MNDSANPQSTRSVAFLGVCERVNYTREGSSHSFKYNVIGLKNVVLSYVYPLSFDGFFLALAFSEGVVLKKMKFRLSDENAREVGNFTLEANLTQVSENSFDDLNQSYLRVIPKHGWHPVFIDLQTTKWIIYSPGLYFFDVCFDGEIYMRIGTLEFSAVKARPLTQERISAIRADPSATKGVRVDLACKHCSSIIKIYAALETTSALKTEGGIWYQDAPDRFICECGSTNVDLSHIKNNLHALLGSHRRDSNILNLTPLYEKASLEAVRMYFGHLLSKDPHEEQIQKFVEANPILLHQYVPDRILLKPKILTRYVADFGIVTTQRDLILIEIEKPSTRLMKKDGGIASPLSHALDQVNDWMHDIKEHRHSFLDALSIDKNEINSIKCVVIAGREEGYDAKHLRKLKGRFSGETSFLTYDDLLFAMDALIRKIEAI